MTPAMLDLLMGAPRVSDPRPEIIVDSFAGGGGASTGIEMALGRSPDIAINHDAEALALHAANHPLTEHLNSNIWQVHPGDIVLKYGPIGLLWASPDCKHHSKAKGGKPRERAIRDLAWVVVSWAERGRPRGIILENVEEFSHWGPLDANNMPIADRRGETFRKWILALKRQGYAVEWRELRACHYGAPTIRKRLYLIARRDRLPIVWPKATHGPGLLPYTYRTAADIIDWSIPCRSIFGRERPLAENTLRRIANGIRRFVLENPRPFIVPVTHHGDGRVHSIDEPTRTVTTAPRGELALVTPFVSRQFGKSVGSEIDAPIGATTAGGGGKSALVEPVLAPFVTRFNQNGAGSTMDEPIDTVMAGAPRFGVVAPYLVPRYGEREGQEPRCLPVDQPAPTVVPTGNGGSLAVAWMVQNNGGMVGHEMEEPVSTVVGKVGPQALATAFLSHQYGSATNGGQGDPRRPMKTVTTGGHHAVVETTLAGDEAALDEGAARVSAFLIKYFGSAADGQAVDEPLHTATAKARFGLITVEIEGVPYRIIDIGMRMLTPRELFRAQGFPDDYVIDGPGPDGKPLTKTAQVRMCGNSVCPPVASALVAANFADLALAREAAE